MADYFLMLDGASFEGRIRPALAAGWRQRDFDACRSLCAELTPAARAYFVRYHVGEGETLLGRVADGGLAFDRARWRGLVAEVLLYSAVDIPEFQTCEETLSRLLAPGPCRQAHRGTRDLTFGPAVYRPEHAGYNNAADVARLADYLAAVRPEQWTSADLAEDSEECEEELAFAREWFPALADLFRRARERGGVVVHENIY